jgi:Dynactin subunit p22
MAQTSSNEDEVIKLLEARIASLEDRFGDPPRDAAEGAAPASSAEDALPLAEQVALVARRVAELQAANPGVGDLFRELDETLPLVRDALRSDDLGKGGSREQIALIAAGAGRIQATAQALRVLSDVMKWANADELADVPQLERQFRDTSGGRHAKQTAAALTLEETVRRTMEGLQAESAKSNAQLIEWDALLTKWAERVEALGTKS